MSNKKSTEEIIKDKLDSRGFAFDEKAWSTMEDMLDAQEKRKKRGFFWIFSASMFMILVGGTTIYYYSQKTKVEQKSLTRNNAEVLQNQNNENESLEVENEQKTANSAKNEAIYKESSAKINQNVSKEAIPAVKKGTPLMTEGTPAMAEGTPAMTEGTPAVTEGTPAVTEGTPLITEASSDSAKTAEEALEIAKQNPLTAPGKETNNAWGVIGGVSYWYQYQQTPGVTNHKGGFPITVGIYYQRTLSKRFDLGLSVLYTSRGALNFDNTLISSEFGFGIQSDKTIISPQTLHYLNIPFSVRFNISHRSHIYVGAAYYQLLATTSKITHVTENSFGVISSDTKKQTGNYAGFRKNDVVAFFGYELTLFERMNIGLQFNYGFYDNTINYYNGYFNGSNHYDRNISLQLQLKYDIIKH